MCSFFHLRLFQVVAMRFVSKPIKADGAAFERDALGRTEPALPSAFFSENERFEVETLLGTRRSAKTDRGDRREAPRWYLYTLG